MGQQDPNRTHIAPYRTASRRTRTAHHRIPSHPHPHVILSHPHRTASRPDPHQPKPHPPTLTHIPPSITEAIILVVIWVIGIFVLTISQPFEFAGNGYFGTWGGAICSVGFLTEELQAKMPTSRRFKPAVLFTAAALVVFVESLQYAGKDHDWDWNGDLASAALGDYALVSGLLSLIWGSLILLAVLAHEYQKYTITYARGGGRCHCQPLVNVLFMKELTVRNIKFLPIQLWAAFLLVWWMVCASILTYGFPPYKDFGNGYLGAWAAVVAAAMLLQNEPPPSAPPGAFTATMDDDLDPDANPNALALSGPTMEDAEVGGVRPVLSNDKPPPKRFTAELFATGIYVASLLLLMACVERTVDHNDVGQNIAQASRLKRAGAPPILSPSA